jgi:ribosome-binding protein aMBF1 (putative translation factor)
MAVPTPFYVRICSICGKRVNGESHQTDADGHSIHDECSPSGGHVKKSEGQLTPRTDSDQYES